MFSPDGNYGIGNSLPSAPPVEPAACQGIYPNLLPQAPVPAPVPQPEPEPIAPSLPRAQKRWKVIFASALFGLTIYKLKRHPKPTLFNTTASLGVVVMGSAIVTFALADTQRKRKASIGGVAMNHFASTATPLRMKALYLGTAAGLALLIRYRPRTGAALASVIVTGFVGDWLGRYFGNFIARLLGAEERPQ